jgi:hypothetical protein
MLSKQLAVRANVMIHLNSRTIGSLNAASILDLFVNASEIAVAFFIESVEILLRKSAAMERTSSAG